MHKTTQSLLVLVAGLIAGAAAVAFLSRRTIRRLEIDPAYGILSRVGAERRLARHTRPADVLFLDLDFLHQLNAELGYEEVNRLIRASLQLRHGDAILIYRYYSGDEIVLLIPPGDGAGVAERLRQRLASFGLSATIAVAPAQNLQAAIGHAQQLVMTAKANGQRDCVLLATV